MVKLSNPAYNFGSTTPNPDLVLARFLKHQGAPGVLSGEFFRPRRKDVTCPKGPKAIITFLTFWLNTQQCAKTKGDQNNKATQQLAPRSCYPERFGQTPTPGQFWEPTPLNQRQPNSSSESLVQFSRERHPRGFDHLGFPGCIASHRPERGTKSQSRWQTSVVGGCWTLKSWNPEIHMGVEPKIGEIFPQNGWFISWKTL